MASAGNGVLANSYYKSLYAKIRNSRELTMMALVVNGCKADHPAWLAGLAVDVALRQGWY